MELLSQCRSSPVSTVTLQLSSIVDVSQINYGHWWRNRNIPLSLVDFFTLFLHKAFVWEKAENTYMGSVSFGLGIGVWTNSLTTSKTMRNLLDYCCHTVHVCQYGKSQINPYHHPSHGDTIMHTNLETLTCFYSTVCYRDTLERSGKILQLGITHCTVQHVLTPWTHDQKGTTGSGHSGHGCLCGGVQF